jgi:hypothetical protein
MSPVMGHIGQRLTSTPATDHVNPGIGGELNLFSFYVPLHATKPLHSIQKIVETEQEGLGKVDEDNTDNNELISKKSIYLLANDNLTKPK